VYRDRWIECTDTGIRVRFYYFPWGTKTIPYSRIRAVRRVSMGTLRGRGRIWGTANPGYWAHLDPSRPRKSVALVLLTGGRIKPYLTPDDPDAVVEEILARNPSTTVADGDGPLL
jgi:hypothetical protein